MYHVGDWIVYGKTGVCRVVEIKKMDSPLSTGGNGDQKLYYVLRPLSQDCTISTPVDNSKVFMRPAISQAQAEELIATIPFIDVETYHSQSPHELAEHYRGYIATHDCRDLIALTMSLYAKKNPDGDQKSKFGTVDQKFMQQAEGLLFDELSIALGISKEEVREYIVSRVEGGSDGGE